MKYLTVELRVFVGAERICKTLKIHGMNNMKFAYI
jgi:hypothetical protein